MSKLFESSEINGLKLENRFVCSATWEGMATDEGVADYISMSRPLIRELDLINRWKAGNFTKSACFSDNKCFQPAIEGKGISCVTAKREKAK